MDTIKSCMGYCFHIFNELSMKIKEIIQRVQSLYSVGVQSDDTRLSNRHIYSVLMSIRSTLITQQLKKKQKISSWNLQSIPCIELIEVEAHQCPCIPPIGCKILRSKYKLPNPLSGLNGHIINSVTTIDRSIKIDETSINSINYQRGNKFTKNKLSYFIDGGYIYLNTDSNIRVISLTAVFEDPIKVIEFNNTNSACSNNNPKCLDYLEENFPIDMDLESTLIQMTNEELLQVFKPIEDTSSNTRDSAIQQSK